MENKLKTILSGTGFYVALAACVLAAGVGGYFLLFHEDPQPEEDLPALAEDSAFSPYVRETEPVVETTAPAPLEAAPEKTAPEPPPAPMPEAEGGDSPVIAEAPRLIVSPLNGEVVTVFAVDELVYNETMADWRTHDGLDIAAPQGTTVLAASSGTVSAVTEDPMMGTMVVIDHDGGYQTTYANLQARPNVRMGESVSAGQIIGAVGSTAPAESAKGPHLHFSVSKDGVPMDPEAYLKQ